MIKFLKRNIIGISLIFVILPIILFIFGFLKIYVAIPFAAVILICYYKIIKSETLIENEVFFSKKEIIICGIVILIWVLFSGIGNFAYQNGEYNDWEVRNAVLRDLVNYDWPVIFETEDMMHATEELQGIDKISLVYYFTYWLPAALVGKMFGLVAANVFLYIWTFLILMTILYLMKVFLKKNAFLILFFLIFFSGMDILGSLKNGANISELSHLEWWCHNVIQYSSNTTQLYWVFNQSITSWLITILILNVKEKSSIIFIAPLIFCYSPFATFGIIPIVAYLIIDKILKEKEKKENLKKLIFSFETLNIVLLLIVFGTYYLSADSSISVRGFILNQIPIEAGTFILYYILFCLLEFLVYIFLIKRTEKNIDGLFWVIFVELMLIPFYKMTPANDFCMRSSITPLFILMLFFIKYISEIEQKTVIEKMIVTIIVSFSMITPINEIYRSIHYTCTSTKDNYIRESKIYSIANPITKEGLELCQAQFYNKNIDNSFFGKYLLKNN